MNRKFLAGLLGVCFVVTIALPCTAGVPKGVNSPTFRGSTVVSIDYANESLNNSRATHKCQVVGNDCRGQCPNSETCLKKVTGYNQGPTGGSVEVFYCYCSR